MSVEEFDLTEKEIFEKTKQEANWWIILGRSIPIIALGGLFFFEIIGWEKMYDKAIIIGATLFFCVSVVWWWWAIYKIKNIADILSKAVTNFKSVKEDLKDIKKELK